MNPLTQLPDANGQQAFALPGNVNTHIERVNLVADADQAITPPSGAKFAVFNFPNNFFARYGAAAARTGATTTDGTGSEQNPAVRDIRKIGGDDDIHLISESNQIGSITFFS